MNPAKAEATRLHSLVVRTRDRCCQGCARPGYLNADGLPVMGLECAHILRRGLASTRTDERNGIALCSWCHADFTARPMAWLGWARDHVGQDVFDDLEAKSKDLSAVDWLAEVVRLRAVLCEMKR